MLLLIMFVPHHHHHGGSACYAHIIHTHHVDRCAETDQPCEDKSGDAGHCVFLKSGISQYNKAGQDESQPLPLVYGALPASSITVPLATDFHTGIDCRYRFSVVSSPERHFSRRGPPCQG